MLHLNSLEVRHVRGIAGKGPDLVLGGKSLVLLGDNATGKSSYIDALEYLLTKQCTSLDINREGVKWEDGGLHILANPKDLFIKGEFGDGKDTHSIDHNTDHSALKSPLKEWIRAAQQRCFLLRRRTLLKLIEARPKERYEALSPFFALDKFGAFEKEIKSLATEQESKVLGLYRTASTEEESIRRSFNIAQGVLLDEKLVFGALNQRLTPLGKGPVNTIEAAQKLQADVAQQMKGFSGIEQAVALETTLQTVHAIPSAKATAEALEVLLTLRINVEQLESGLTKGFAVEVLERGRSWILGGDLAHCPLCEQILNNKPAIMARIATRIQECSAVIDARKSLEDQRKLYSDSLVELGKACATAQKTWADKLKQDPEGLTGALAELRRIAKELGKDTPAASDLKRHLAEFRAIQIDTKTLSFADQLKQQVKELGGIDQYKDLSAANQALATISVNWPALLIARTKYATQQNIKLTIDKVVAHSVQARKEAVQSILLGIADEANRIYLDLHPEEKIGAVTLKVPTRGDGSVNMESQFFDKRGDARLYFSESHLDTLGVALFLALRKKQALSDPHFKLLVLDDVFHSVDSRHRLRAARLIIKEFKDHQFIITTHDSIWFSLLQEAVNDLGLRESVLFRRISDWTLESGPIWGDHDAEYAFLTSDRINTALPADVAVRAGRLLEEMLKPLCDQLKVSIQFRNNHRYDLGALWPAFKSYALKHPGFSAKHKALIEEIDQVDWIRNEIGAHSNVSPAPPTMGEAKKFAQSIVALYTAARDASCGRFIEVVMAPEGDWVCRCGTLRYPKRGPPPAKV